MDISEIRKLEDLYLRLLTVETALEVPNDLLRSEYEKQPPLSPQFMCERLFQIGGKVLLLALEAQEVMHSLRQGIAVAYNPGKHGPA